MAQGVTDPSYVCFLDDPVVEIGHQVRLAIFGRAFRGRAVRE
jgi:hypothetical protein